MTTYFLDTSAIVKRYILEQGRIWILSLCDPQQNQAPPPIFVCADVGLLDIAGAEGLQIENPNKYQ